MRDAMVRWLAGIAACAALAAPARAQDAPRRLTFADAVRIASSESPSAQQGSLREREAAARTGQTRAGLLPQVSGNAFQSNRTFNILAQGFSFPGLPIPALVGPFDVVDARVTVRQSLIDVSTWRKLGATRTGERATHADREASDESAAQQAALAYLRAARAEALVAARGEDLALARVLQDLARQQQAAGVSPAIDTTRASTQVAESLGALLIARDQRDRARLDLARAMGADPAEPFVLADTLSDALGASAAPESAGAAVALALTRRPELAAEQARLDRARADRTATALELVPKLDAEADWGKSGQRTSDWITTRAYGVALSMPVLDGLRRESRMAEQSALARESEVRVKDLRDQVAAEVRGALLDLAAGREQKQVAAERLQLAEEEVAQARDRFENGIAGNIEVITAQASLLRARDAEIDARFAVAAARVALARSAGLARELR